MNKLPKNFELHRAYMKAQYTKARCCIGATDFVCIVHVIVYVCISLHDSMYVCGYNVFRPLIAACTISIIELIPEIQK